MGLRVYGETGPALTWLLQAEKKSWSLETKALVHSTLAIHGKTDVALPESLHKLSNKIETLTPPCWLAASQALHINGGEPWQEWQVALQKMLLSRQVKDGPESGSWPPTGKCDRVRTTALATLSLLTARRYAWKVKNP